MLYCQSCSFLRLTGRGQEDIKWTKSCSGKLSRHAGEAGLVGTQTCA